MIRQGIAGSSVDPSNPVTLSFKHINSEGGRPIEVRVYGINGTNSWLPFSPFDCTGLCGVLFLHHHYSFLSRDVGLADPHGDFHTWGSHAVIGVGIFPAGFNRYARGVDDVVLSQNQPPVCNAAEASIATRWSPNHQLVPIDILGVTDPDGAPVTITVDGIFQDEPGNGLGDGDTAPDGAGVGTSVAQIRAERAGGGNGCFYQISFTADDGNGGECQGSVLVGVPKSQAKNGAPVDDGALFDSTTL